MQYTDPPIDLPIQGVLMRFPLPWPQGLSREGCSGSHRRRIYWPYYGSAHLTNGKSALQISVRSNVDKALKGMSVLQRKQMPFAAALGLSMTAKKVMKVEQRMMVSSWIDQRRLPSKALGGRVLTKLTSSWDACTPVFT